MRKEAQVFFAAFSDELKKIATLPPAGATGEILAHTGPAAKKISKSVIEKYAPHALAGLAGLGAVGTAGLGTGLAAGVGGTLGAQRLGTDVAMGEHQRRLQKVQRMQMQMGSGGGFY